MWSWVVSIRTTRLGVKVARRGAPTCIFPAKMTRPSLYSLGRGHTRGRRLNMAPRPRQKPAVAGSGWSWNRVENFDPAAFKSVDGAKIFRTMYSYCANSNRMVLHWVVGPLLNKSQKALVADIQNQRDISLEVEFSKECQQQGVTQVPYREFTVNYSICKFGIPFDWLKIISFCIQL